MVRDLREGDSAARRDLRGVLVTTSKTDLCPFPELDNGIPAEGFVLHHPPSGLWGCYCHKGVHGLTYFSERCNAERFALVIEGHTGLHGLTPISVTFDQASDIAKARPRPISCVMLLDDVINPSWVYVR